MHIITRNIKYRFMQKFRRKYYFAIKRTFWIKCSTYTTMFTIFYITIIKMISIFSLIPFVSHFNNECILVSLQDKYGASKIEGTNASGKYEWPLIPHSLQ